MKEDETTTVEVKSGDVVALTSVDGKRVIYLYRVDKVYKDRTNRCRLAWNKNVPAVYEVEVRKTVKVKELYLESKRVISGDKIPSALVRKYLEFEKREQNEYKQKKSGLIFKALSDKKNGKEPLLYKKNGQLYYVTNDTTKLLVEDEYFTCNCFSTLVKDLKEEGYLHGNSMVNGESRVFYFKERSEVANEDVGIQSEYVRLMSI